MVTRPSWASWIGEGLHGDDRVLLGSPVQQSLDHLRERDSRRRKSACPFLELRRSSYHNYQPRLKLKGQRFIEVPQIFVTVQIPVSPLEVACEHGASNRGTVAAVLVGTTSMYCTWICSDFSRVIEWSGCEFHRQLNSNFLRSRTVEMLLVAFVRDLIFVV